MCGTNTGRSVYLQKKSMSLNCTVRVTRRICKIPLTYPQGIHLTMPTRMMELMYAMYLRVHGYILLHRDNNPKGQGRLVDTGGFIIPPCITFACF